MTTRLSCALTWFYKVGFALLWTGAFGAIAVASFLSGMKEKWFFLIFAISGGSISWGLGRTLKRVAIENNELIVSNYWRAIRVPTSEIASVSQSRFLQPQQITIWLHNPTQFGPSITFIPAGFICRFSEGRVTDILIAHGATHLTNNAARRVAGSEHFAKARKAQRPSG